MPQEARAEMSATVPDWLGHTRRIATFGHFRQPSIGSVCVVHLRSLGSQAWHVSLHRDPFAVSFSTLIFFDTHKPTSNTERHIRREERGAPLRGGRYRVLA